MSEKDISYYVIASVLLFVGSATLVILFYLWIGWWSLLAYTLVSVPVGRVIFRRRMSELESVFDGFDDLTKQ